MKSVCYTSVKVLLEIFHFLRSDFEKQILKGAKYPILEKGQNVVLGWLVHSRSITKL